jgi:hypothetical protein
VIFNLGGGKPLKWAMGTAPQVDGIMTISNMPFRPDIVVARPSASGVAGISGICSLYFINPDTEEVIFAKRKAASGSDFVAMSTSDYSWDDGTKTLTLRTGATSNSYDTSSYFAIGK